MHKPLLIDLYSGLHGWSLPFVEAGWRVIAIDIVDMHRELGLPRPPGIELVLQDVRTLNGAQLREAALIVASPPCQEFSYRAMPWKRAKALPPPVLGIDLFWQCWRIQHEASEAAGREIPLIVENVKGAQKWVGRAAWHYGSFYLWGSIPALMPKAGAVKVPGMNWSGSDKPGYVARGLNVEAAKAIKNNGGSWFAVGSPGQKETGQNPVNGLKNKDSDGYEHTHPNAFGWKAPRPSSRSQARKAASAMIARIPEPLARHIAQVFRP